MFATQQYYDKSCEVLICNEPSRFLGYTLSAEGVQPQKRLTEAIPNFQRPSTRMVLKRFLGTLEFL